MAGVQQAAHRIMMTVAAASVFWGHERRPKKTPRERERDRRRREMKKMSVQEDERTERQTKMLPGGLGGLTLKRWVQKEQHTKEGEDRRAVCLCWIISVGSRLCVPAVDCGLCKNSRERRPVCQSLSAFSVSFGSGGLQTFIHVRWGKK